MYEYLSKWPIIALKKTERQIRISLKYSTSKKFRIWNQFLMRKLQLKKPWNNMKNYTDYFLKLGYRL